TDKEGWIDQITRLGSTHLADPPPRETFRRVRMVEPLSPGDAMPDYAFTNELGQAIHLGQFKGQALGLTFIYTRCPFPTFCLRMQRMEGGGVPGGNGQGGENNIKVAPAPGGPIPASRRLAARADFLGARSLFRFNAYWSLGAIRLPVPMRGQPLCG